MRLRSTLAAVLAAAALAGCGVGKSVGNLYDRWFGSAPSVKPAPLVTFKALTDAKIVWRGSVGPAERTVFFPAVIGNRVYAAGASGQILGFDAKNGTVVTKLNAGQKLTGGVAASGSLVLVGTAKGEVLAFEPSGKQIWKAPLAGEVLAPPALDGALVAVRAGDGRIYGLDAVGSPGTELEFAL